MEIPAYISPSLCVGRTFDVGKFRVGRDIFSAFIPTKTLDVNKYSFRYKTIETKKDVRDLLDISGELSLLLKTNTLTASGIGHYVKESRTMDGIQEILAVIRWNTVCETVDEEAKPNEDITSSQLVDTGTHFVTETTYGAEIVASFKFKASPESRKQAVKGSAEGQLNFQGHNSALEAQLEKLLAALGDLPDMFVRYYDTTLPNNRLATIKDIRGLIEELPSRLKCINNGRGIPIKFQLQTIQDIAPRTRSNTILDDLESRLDDLLICQSLVKEYAEGKDSTNDEVTTFSSQINKVFRKFRAAACSMNTDEEEDDTRACLEAYENALDGENDIGKFYRHWSKISASKTKSQPAMSCELPQGKRLTVVLFGKTGNGKSATGNTILGEKVFEVSASAASVTAQCQYGSRVDGREIDVIDTPGVLDTGSLSGMSTFKGLLKENAEHQKNILQEVSKIFSMAPFGFDAIILVVKYGCRFTMEDAQALKMLQALLEGDAMGHMILLLTHGDQAEYEADEEEISTEQRVGGWLKTLPSWVQSFINQIGNRVVLINNTLRSHKDQEAYRKQLSKLIQVIDDMTKDKGPFGNRLTLASKDAVEERIQESLRASGLMEEDERLEKEREELERRMKSLLEIEKRKELELQLAENKREAFAAQQKKSILVTQAVHAQAKMSKEGSGGDIIQQFPKSILGGCFPESATFVDKQGRKRRMESLKTGEEVQVNTEKGVRLEPVMTYIHRHPNVVQEFLKITTMKNGKILKITEDHLLFVEKKGQACAIPARDVSIGDAVYVRGDQHAVETDVVQSISNVIEKGVYAPVTLSGTILVNDVHTSCYFDVLSHEWSHRAMGAARALYHVSPWMVEWISGVGEKDGIPGWCRLVHDVFTRLNSLLTLQGPRLKE